MRHGRNAFFSPRSHLSVLLTVCWQTLGGRCRGSLFVPTTGTELSQTGSWSCALPSQGWRMGKVSSIPAPSKGDLETWRCSVTIPKVQGRQGCTPETFWVPHP